jgi:ring-1,2-phenylacetyl-CoA epoxidase subunit PaaC
VSAARCNNGNQTMSITDQNTDLLNYTIALGDDALMLGQRLSEWCSNAPFLEEDLALANVALDFIGRARMLFAYAAELEGRGRSEDDIAYLRDCRDYRNLLIAELPRGDFAFSTARQFLVDVWNIGFLDALGASKDPQLAGIAAKGLKESRYHLRRSRDWMLRLGDGTEESRARVQDALEQLWGYTPELFGMDAAESRLLERGVAVDRAALRAGWDSKVNEVLAEAGLSRPADAWSVSGGRDGVHTEHLGHLLSELQFLQRTYPGQQW